MTGHGYGPHRDDSCKGCAADVRVSEQQIDRLLAVLESKGFDGVNDEEYERRIALCERCPSLQYETTCRHCGCLVKIRAKMADKHCPLPGNAQW